MRTKYTYGAPKPITTSTTDEFGNPKFAPSLDYNEGLVAKKCSSSYKFEVIKEQVNFSDIEITTQIYLRGGEAVVAEEDLNNVYKDDVVEFWLIDKNDTLGMFSQLGYTVGQDIWYIKWFIKDYVMYNPKSTNYKLQAYEAIIGKSLVYAGLFLRVKIDASNNTIGNYNYIPRIYWYE